MMDEYFVNNWLYNADEKGWDISMETRDDYYEETFLRDATYDGLHAGIPNTEYDEYFKKHDEYINDKSIGDIPALDAKFGFVMRDPYTQDRYTNDQYLTNPEAYCELKKRTLSAACEPKNGPEIQTWTTHNYNAQGVCTVTNGTRVNLSHVAALPMELLHLHDAVFPEGEEVKSVEIRTPLRVKHWWDSDVIDDEYGYAPKPQDSAEYRVDWYLGHQTKEKQ